MTSAHGITPSKVTRATYRTRLAAERAERIARIAEQVADGSLTVRPMTDEERAKWGPAKNLKPPRGARGASLAVPHATDEQFA